MNRATERTLFRCWKDYQKECGVNMPLITSVQEFIWRFSTAENRLGTLANDDVVQVLRDHGLEIIDRDGTQDLPDRFNQSDWVLSPSAKYLGVDVNDSLDETQHQLRVLQDGRVINDKLIRIEHPY